MPDFFADVPIGANLLFSLNGHPRKAKTIKYHVERIRSPGFIQDFSNYIISCPEVSTHEKTFFHTNQYGKHIGLFCLNRVFERLHYLTCSQDLPREMAASPISWGELLTIFLRDLRALP